MVHIAACVNGKTKSGVRAVRTIEELCFGVSAIKRYAVLKRGLNIVGNAQNMPCQKLSDLFDDPEYGDHGARLRNLKNWKDGICTYEKLGNTAQEKAKNLKAIDNIND